MSDERYPTAVRLIGVMEKDSSKMFMASVLWSDHSEIVVYRSFQEFKKLHKQLKKLFPVKKTFGTSERVIPRFRARNTKTVQRNDSSKSLRRLSFLENYCTELLKCEPSVTQSSEVIQFFLPQHQDLQPEFSKNSIVILPLEDIADSNDRGIDAIGGKRFSMGNVTQPYVPESYRCVAPYETKDTKNRAFRVAVDETVDVLIKDKAGWWLVENDAKCLAWFPAPYLVKCEDGEGEEDYDDGTPAVGLMYRAVRNYTSKKEDEVSVHIGSVVEVLQRSEDGWWLIRNKGKAGYVPSMYLQPYINPLVQVQKEMRSSTLNMAQLHNSDPFPPMPRGTLSTANKKRSRSLDILAEPHQSHVLPPVPTENESRKSSLSGVSLGSESSFSDDCSSPGSDSLSGSPTGTVELHSADGGLTEGRFSRRSSDLNLLKISSAPKVPPRPRDQEILSRCTTFTRKAALASKARLPELKQMQGR
ncbi:NADPH oxidase organizer 1-like [Conger conger]|uniref:NADPH oxidase organizer 1-like n=1 Tax=Conger conger TaxID=82655 RepID=UPI002A5AD635|nr:NADPH oxidase organizer 1-like [Conger conger]